MAMQRVKMAQAVCAAWVGALAAAGAAPAFAHGQHGGHDDQGDSLGAHVHGLAQLTVAQDAGAVEIVFTSAMWNLVGFERAPENDAERAVLAAAAAALSDPLALFGVPTSAGCAVTAAAPGLTPAAIAAGPASADSDGHDHDHNHDKDHGHDHEGHDHGETSVASAGYDAGDLSAQWTLACTAPSEFRSLRPTMFTAFANLETVEAAYIGERQRAATLTRARSDFQID